MDDALISGKTTIDSFNWILAYAKLKKNKYVPSPFSLKCLMFISNSESGYCIDIMDIDVSSKFLL